MFKDKTTQIFKEYCTGCGLCKSVAGVELKTNGKGFIFADLKEKDVEFCKRVCPAGGRSLNCFSDNTMWGTIKNAYFGWSLDNDIRFRAASGGVLTAVCMYLIDKGVVDGIIQVKTDPTDVCKTVTVISRSTDDIISCMGSRYTTSEPLANLMSMIKTGEKYAFVGRPCDVSALKMYLKEDTTLSEQIIYLFAFFCGGQPSRDANAKLLNSLGCDNKTSCRELTYRGNGWPGRISIVKDDGSRNDMDYSYAWGRILGRDVRKCCRFCVDGVGEMADIACGDGWHIKEDGRPDFSEHEGRNIIFSRTDAGEALLNQAYKDGYIQINVVRDTIDTMKLIQPYQFIRKACMFSVITAMKLCGKSVPMYEIKKLRAVSKQVSVKVRLRRFAGIIKRVIRGDLV